MLAPSAAPTPNPIATRFARSSPSTIALCAAAALSTPPDLAQSQSRLHTPRTVVNEALGCVYGMMKVGREVDGVSGSITLPVAAALSAALRCILPSLFGSCTCFRAFQCTGVRVFQRS